MAGLVTAEKQVIANPADTYGYTAEQRSLAASIRSVVPVASRTEAETVATNMAADGRAVSDTNPLVVYRTDIDQLEVKSASGWWTTGQKVAEFTGGAVNYPAGSLWGPGTLTEATTGSKASINNDFATGGNEVLTLTKPGTYLCQGVLFGTNSAPPVGWLGWRKGDDSVLHTEHGTGGGLSWAATHLATVVTTAANETVRLRVLMNAAWATSSSKVTITKLQ